MMSHIHMKHVTFLRGHIVEMIAVQFVIADSKSTYLKKSHITIMHYKN